MNTCLHCSAPISQTPGKRKKVFCSDACRSQHWAKREVVADSWQEKYYNIKELYDPLLNRVADLESENAQLKAKIDYLEPLATSHQQRMNGVTEAIKAAPKQELTTTPPPEAYDNPKNDLLSDWEIRLQQFSKNKNKK